MSCWICPPPPPRWVRPIPYPPGSVLTEKEKLRRRLALIQVQHRAKDLLALFFMDPALDRRDFGRACDEVTQALRQWRFTPPCPWWFPADLLCFRWARRWLGGVWFYFGRERPHSSHQLSPHWSRTIWTDVWEVTRVEWYPSRRG